MFYVVYKLKENKAVNLQMIDHRGSEIEVKSELYVVAQSLCKSCICGIFAKVVSL